MSTEIFEAKSGAKLVELTLRSGASVAHKSGRLPREKRSASQEGASEVSTTRRLSVMLNYVLDLPDYVLDLSDYARTSDACIV